ncbi:MAG: phosphate signaling complex protein PhoU [Gemmatimonadetes bacterium]|nr:phosphate signaling complex protein PhoU [Gemmatimonadota bacterium]
MNPERGHRHFHDELAALQARLVQMGGAAEELVRLAVDALLARDVEKAEAVVRRDQEIDDLEVEIDERALRLLALQQPMASDLRLIMTALKASNDVERVGDHAVNVAHAVRRLGAGAPLPERRDIEEMAGISLGMLADALAAFVSRDAKLARDVCVRDDRLDALRNSVARTLITQMLEDPRAITSALDLFLVAQNLERIGDLATNISEDVVFLVEGRSIKHHVEERSRGAADISAVGDADE